LTLPALRRTATISLLLSHRSTAGGGVVFQAYGRQWGSGAGGGDDCVGDRLPYYSIDFELFRARPFPLDVRVDFWATSEGDKSQEQEETRSNISTSESQSVSV